MIRISPAEQIGSIVKPIQTRQLKCTGPSTYISEEVLEVSLVSKLATEVVIDGWSKLMVPGRELWVVVSPVTSLLPINPLVPVPTDKSLDSVLLYNSEIQLYGEH